MLTSKKTLLLHILIFSSLLSITQYTYPTFPEDFTITPYQSYIIACITSCCVGILLCALFQRCTKAPIVPKESQNMQELKTKLDNAEKKLDLIGQNGKEISDLLAKQNDDIHIIVGDKTLEKHMERIAILQDQINLLEKRKQTLLELSEEFKKNSLCLPVAAALYWFKKYHAIMDKNDAPLNIAQT